ncbi:hypothetical protein PINS_up000184 [Pythium insidiosum]|nr:hypothetical protein PINS_up000184 [Pythium insidiosum]
MGDRSDSDGEDAMAYFLPNGITDDSPPKRSAMMPASFGPIGARFGSDASTAPPATSISSDLTAFGSFGGILGGQSAPTTASSATPANSFLLHELGGEIHDPSPSSSSSASGIGSSVGSFAFSGGFGSLGGRAESTELSLHTATPHGLFGRGSELNSGSRIGAQSSSFRASASPFRSDADPFVPSSASTTTTSLGGAVYGRPPRSGPSYRASTADNDGYTTGSSWPSATSGSLSNTTTKPRRAPPGLGGPSTDIPRMLDRGSQDQPVMSGPPGLSVDSPSAASSPFGSFSSPSIFGSPHQFGGGLPPSLSTLHISSPDRFLDDRRGKEEPHQEFFNADLAELNAKSIRVEEAQSKVVGPLSRSSMQDTIPEKANRRSGESTPRRATRSPRTGTDQGSSKSTGKDEKRRDGRERSRGGHRRSEQAPQGSPDQTDTTQSVLQRSGKRGEDRRSAQAAVNRSGKDANPGGTDASSRGGPPETSSSKSSRKSRGEGKTSSRNTSADISIPMSVTKTEKAPSSVSSIGSEEQQALLLSVVETDSNAGSALGKGFKDRDSPRETKTGSKAKNKAAASRTVEKSNASRRQLYREKQRELAVDSVEDKVESAPPLSEVLEEKTPRVPNSMLEPSNVPEQLSPGQSSNKPAPEHAHEPITGAAAPSSHEAKRNSPKHSRSNGNKKRDIPKSIQQAPGITALTEQHGPRLNDTQLQSIAGESPPSSVGVGVAPVITNDPTRTDGTIARGRHADNDDAKKKRQKPGTPTKNEAVGSATRLESAETQAQPLGIVNGKDASGVLGPIGNDSEAKDVQQCDTDVFTAPDVTQTSPSDDSHDERSDTTVQQVSSGHSGKKSASKESKKDKHKKDKSEKKKSGSSKTKKEKRDSSSSGKGDLADEPLLDNHDATVGQSTLVASSSVLFSSLRDCFNASQRFVLAVSRSIWHAVAKLIDQLNLKGVIMAGFTYLESILAVVFSVILLLSLHGASWFIRLHRVAFRAILTHRHIGFCFAFLYAFPFLVQYVFPWAPPWAPVCLWYAFLVQLFCTNGPTAMVTSFRIILPLVFLVEGISHHSFLLDLNGAELLLASFILSALKTSNLCSPIFLLSLAAQCLSAVFLGSELVVQWFQMALALYSLHAMAATEEDWAGLRDDEDELSCQSMSMHHSIADYSYQPAPSAQSIQKTKRLDRRALAYVRGRKFR